MSFYELTLIARQDISTSACEALTDRLIGLIEADGGKIYKREYWGLRALAYRIRKNRKGHYVHLGIEIGGQAIHELERRMRLDDDVLRYLTLKAPTADAAQSPMMLAHSEDESRPNTRPGSRSAGHEDNGVEATDENPKDVVVAAKSEEEQQEVPQDA